MLARNLSALLAIALLGATSVGQACELPTERPYQQSSLPQEGFDSARFLEQVRTKLNGRVMGYSVVLRNGRGKVIAEAGHGYARTPCDRGGAKEFRSSTQAAWGEITEVLTTAAVVDKTESSTTRNLDERLVEFLPARWRERVHPSHQALTIRDVLSGRAPFRTYARAPQLLQQLTTPRLEALVQQADGSFALVGAMGRFFRAGYWDKVDSGFKDKEASYDDFVLDKASTIYLGVLQRRFFRPLNIKGSCNDADYAGDDYANYYDTTFSGKGYFLDSGEKPSCPANGVVMNSRDMSKFVYALSRTGRVVSKDNYKSLFIPTDRGKALGWAAAEAVNGGLAHRHSGRRALQAPGSGEEVIHGVAAAEVASFPNGMTVAIAVNSRRTEGTSTLFSILKESYEASLKASTPSKPPASE